MRQLPDSIILEKTNIADLFITKTISMKNIILICLVLSTYANADDSYSSQQLLTKSLNRLNPNQFDSPQEINEVSNWLVGLPTAGISVLQSDNKLGADEYELSINLPFKSRMRKNLDKQLASQTQSIVAIAQQNKALFVSGLIRETIWQYKIAQKKRDIEQSKLDWLNKQKVRLTQLVQSGGSNLDLLFVEKQLLDAQLLMLELNQQIQLRLSQFQDITGLPQIPEKFYEEGINEDHLILNKHPMVQQLQLSMQQADVQYQLAGKSSNPINVSLTALDINAIGANDRQYGVGIEVPIGLSKSKTQADSSSWLQQQNNISNQLITFERAFKTQFSELRGEHKFLTNKQGLLEQQAQKTKQIFTQLEQLRYNNELNQGLFFQRMIELIASIHQSELNQLYINQNQSRQKQLAGATL